MLILGIVIVAAFVVGLVWFMGSTDGEYGTAILVLLGSTAVALVLAFGVMLIVAGATGSTLAKVWSDQ